MAQFERVTGKYIYVQVQGLEYRVYFEENGRGIPLICQHTAGSDGRQWRYLLNDEEITSLCRVIVPDLPYHGKSLPPESVEYWKQEYKLTKSFLMDFHVAFKHALRLERPVYIGCSIGGQLAPDLALERPDEFRAVIGVEASLGEGGPRARRGNEVWCHHPRISNDFRAYAMLGMMAPSSPEKRKRETIWGYSQSAPSVFKGDLYYNFVEHDLTNTAQQIDTSRVPVYLLNGEYDPAASPEDGQALANRIKGSMFIEMKGIGHFGMIENFDVFKKYLMPVLEEIARL